MEAYKIISACLQLEAGIKNMPNHVACARAEEALSGDVYGRYVQPGHIKGAFERVGKKHWTDIKRTKESGLDPNNPEHVQLAKEILISLVQAATQAVRCTLGVSETRPVNKIDTKT